MQLAADPLLVPIATSSGHGVVPLADARLHQLDALLVTGPDGWERTRAWRALGVELTVVVHTDGDAPADRAELEPVVLLRSASPAGLASALGRCGDRRASVSELAGGRFEPRQRKFQLAADRTVPLTPLETRLLAYLASRAGRAVERSELQEEVWDHRAALDTKAVEVAVARLRRKIEPDPAAPVTLLTVRGGYQIALAERTAVRPSDFWGRDAVVAELVRRAAVPRVLIALVGPPGVGKSRVAREVAKELRERRVTVLQVDLDRVPAGVDAGVALATALDLEVPSEGDALQAVFEQVGEGVLLLDHGEQREALTAHVLQQARGRCAVLVATQVVPAGAEVHLLPPLDEEAGSQLLAARSGGAVDAQTARRLVPLLDGLPLALTLAASRLAMMGLQEFERAMGLRLALLSPPEADRHGSLREAVADAVDRLSLPQREALHALTALQGPLGADESTALLGPEGALVLADLVSRGVLAREGGRLRVLHAVRDHVLAQMGPVRPEVERRHVAWAVARVRELEPQLYGSHALAAFPELASLHADLRIAAERAGALADPRSVALLVEGIYALLVITGTELEQLALLDRFEPLAQGDALAEGLMKFMRAKTLLARDRGRAENLAHEARHQLISSSDRAVRATLLVVTLIYRHTPLLALEALLDVDLTRLDPANALRVQSWMSLVRHYLGELSLLDMLAEMSLAMDELAELDALLDAVNIGTMLVPMLRNVHPERCLPLLQRVAEWSVLLREPYTTAHIQALLATEAWRAGRLDEARQVLDEAERLVGKLQPNSRTLRQRRAWLEMQVGNHELARAIYEEVLGRVRRQGDLGVVAEVLIHLVLVEADAGRPSAATARALEATELCERMSRPDLAAHAALSLGLAWLLAGDAAGAYSALAGIERGRLAPTSQLSWLSTSIVAAILLGRPTAAMDAELDTQIAEGAPALVGQIVAAGRAGRKVEPQGDTVDLRLLARVWTLLAAR